MEKLLHYVWQQKAFPYPMPTTDEGEEVCVIDTGLHNFDAGPDFFNAKVKIGNMAWVGNVEIHEKSSDWKRHGHDKDPAYDNVILHVAEKTDCEIFNSKGERIPQIRLSVPDDIAQRYDELVREEAYPPCYRVIPSIDRERVREWMETLLYERLDDKAKRICAILDRTNNDWEQALFATLARNFGFGVNGFAFEEWAKGISLKDIGKHRDDLFQIEAYFFGQAGLLQPEMVQEEKRDDYFNRLRHEYGFLANKFGLTPADPKMWRFLRMRPQNFPHVRLSQLAGLYHRGRVGFAKLLDTTDLGEMKRMFEAEASEYWNTHYSFGSESTTRHKALRSGSQDLLLVNTVAPLLYVYGEKHAATDYRRRAVELLRGISPENNFITRSWKTAGIRSLSAADSQALIQLRKNYCDRKDCLRCRIGFAYLGSK